MDRVASSAIRLFTYIHTYTHIYEKRYNTYMDAAYIHYIHGCMHALHTWMHAYIHVCENSVYILITSQRCGLSGISAISLFTYIHTYTHIYEKTYNTYMDACMHACITYMCVRILFIY